MFVVGFHVTRRNAEYAIKLPEAGKINSENHTIKEISCPLRKKKSTGNVDIRIVTDIVIRPNFHTHIHFH